MAWSLVPNWHIVLTPEEAAQVRGNTTVFTALDPVRVQDDRYILSLGVLDDAAHAKHIPFLAGLPRCRLEEGDDGMRVKPGSERPGDLSILERTYKPSDKQNPLNNPPMPAKGDWSEARLYESVGRALSQWELFETRFAELFTACLGPSLNSTPAHRAYGSIISFDGRSNMVRAAAEACLRAYPNGRIERAFGKVYGAATKLSGHRNKIAHGVVNGYATPAGVASGVALVPPEYATNRRKLADNRQDLTVPDYAYTSGEVRFFATQFEALRAPTAKLTIALDAFVSRRAALSLQSAAQP